MTINHKKIRRENEVGGNIVLLEDDQYNVKIVIEIGIKIKNYYYKYEWGDFPLSIGEII